MLAAPTPVALLLLRLLRLLRLLVLDGPAVVVVLARGGGARQPVQPAVLLLPFLLLLRLLGVLARLNGLMILGLDVGRGLRPA